MTASVSGRRVDPSNAAAARAWNGPDGAYWAANAGRFDRTVAAYREPFLAAAGIASGDRVLDVGCGTGQTSREAARIARDGSVLGVDLSSQMIKLARGLAARQGLRNVAFEQADAQIYPFGAGRFDLVISRAGTMFFGDPEAAFANIARGLRPDGRLAMLVWQGPERNEWFTRLRAALAAGRDLPSPAVGVPGPFALADPDRIRALLTATGFCDVHVDGVQAPMWFGDDAGDAHAFVLGLMGWILDGLDGPGRTGALEALRATVAAHQTGEGVLYSSGAWLVRSRRRPG